MSAGATYFSEWEKMVSQERDCPFFPSFALLEVQWKAKCEKLVLLRRMRVKMNHYTINIDMTISVNHTKGMTIPGVGWYGIDNNYYCTTAECEIWKSSWFCLFLQACPKDNVCLLVQYIRRKRILAVWWFWVSWKACFVLFDKKNETFDPFFSQSTME